MEGLLTLLRLCLMLQLLRLGSSLEEITLKCDEFERSYDSPASEPFCTVSGFIVTHSQNVRIQKYSRANMTKFMKFYGSRLLYVPFKLFDAFSNLKTLDVSFTEILEVPRNTFGSASNLTYLNMSNNNITQITTSVFMGANSLMRLDLSRNQITECSENAFRGLSNLDKLLLSGNLLKTLDKDIFLENPYVENIALDNNLLEYIEPEVFSRLRRIREVNLSHNRLRHIHQDSFYSAYGLESLMLSANQLNEFQLRNKSIMTQLQVDNNNLTILAINGTKFVRADHNHISQVLTINTMFLESLQLTYNNISDISNITNLTGLLQLDLSYNPVRQLNISTFDRLKRLRSLTLRATGISHLTFGMFSKQVNLETFDLSFNNLTELNLNIFVPYLANVKSFFVDANNLTELQGMRSFSNAFPNLQKLGVSRNRFNCSYLHTLLIPPNLLGSVTLHIEPDVDNEAETSHIRDVSCVSNVRQNLQSVELELDDMTKLQRIMEQSMAALQVYLLWLKIALVLIVSVSVFAIFALLGRYWKLKRRDYFARRGASIIFHSGATTNSIAEP